MLLKHDLEKENLGVSSSPTQRLSLSSLPLATYATCWHVSSRTGADETDMLLFPVFALSANSRGPTDMGRRSSCLGAIGLEIRPAQNAPRVIVVALNFKVNFSDVVLFRHVGAGGRVRFVVLVVINETGCLVCFAGG